MFCIDKKQFQRWPKMVMTQVSAKTSYLLEMIATDSASVSATKAWGCTYRRRHVSEIHPHATYHHALQ